MKKRQLITEAGVRDAAQGGKSTLRIDANAIITPLALDAAQRMGVRFEFIQPDAHANAEKTVALAVAQTGFPIKRAVIDIINVRSYEYTEIRNSASDIVVMTVDAVKSVVSGASAFAVIIDETGILSCMIANRFEGIRAVNATDIRHAQIARKQFHANVLTLGAGFLTPKRAGDVLAAFFDTPAVNA